jgi:hypothetical protein
MVSAGRASSEWCQPGGLRTRNAAAFSFWAVIQLAVAPFNLRKRLTETAGSSTPQKSSLVDKSEAAYAVLLMFS